jgi:hypothetical protein
VALLNYLVLLEQDWELSFLYQLCLLILVFLIELAFQQLLKLLSTRFGLWNKKIVFFNYKRTK